MPQQTTQKQTGGFDEEVSTRAAEREHFLHADIEYTVVTLRVRYTTRYSDRVKTTTVSHINHLLGTMGRKTRPLGVDPETLLCVTPESMNESIFVKLSEDELLNFIDFDSITSEPTYKTDSLNCKINGDTCIIEGVGECAIVDEPESWISLGYYLNNTDELRFRRSKNCGKTVVSRLRKAWARENDCYDSEWTIESVDDSEDTDTATLTLVSKDDLPNAVEFTLEAPDDWSDDNPKRKFVEETGGGLIGNAEHADCYTSFDELEDAEPVATNEYGLKLYAPSDKPSGIIHRLKTLIA